MIPGFRFWVFCFCQGTILQDCQDLPGSQWSGMKIILVHFNISPQDEIFSVGVMCHTLFAYSIFFFFLLIELADPYFFLIFACVICKYI